MTEVVVLGAGANDERVVGHRLEGTLTGSLAQPHQASVEIDIGRLREQDADVCVAAKDAPQRISDLRCGERSGRHLVDQRLEQVEVASIDQRDIHRKPGEAQGRLEASESAPDDHRAVAPGSCGRVR